MVKSRAPIRTIKAIPIASKILPDGIITIRDTKSYMNQIAAGRGRRDQKMEPILLNHFMLSNRLMYEPQAIMYKFRVNGALQEGFEKLLLA